MIFSSSITRGINTNGFNKQLHNCEAKFHKFHGKTAHDIKKYIPPHIAEGHPDSVIIVAGGNDVPIGRFDTVPLSIIADDITEAALLCKTEGVKHIYVSSILPRSSCYFQARRNKLNNMLKERCRINGFVYIDNENITLKKHIGYDGVHLKQIVSLLCRNLYNCLNRKS